MVQRVSTVSFEGVEVRPVDVQVQVAPGMPAFTVVGLPDKAVSEALGRWREIDGDAPRRQRQAGRGHGRAHALAPPMPEAKA